MRENREYAYRKTLLRRNSCLQIVDQFVRKEQFTSRSKMIFTQVTRLAAENLPKMDMQLEGAQPFEFHYYVYNNDLI